MQDARRKTQDTRRKTQDASCKTQDKTTQPNSNPNSNPKFVYITAIAAGTTAEKVPGKRGTK